jgi:hypothetical protein
MTLDDIILLGKKILIGIIVTVIPFLILFGGLWFTQKLLQQPPDAASKTESHATP